MPRLKAGLRGAALRFNGVRGFLLLLAAYGLWLALIQGAWLASGAVWAEGATNYWVAAHAADWSQRLFATDAGYIPLTQRLLALPGGWMPAAWWPWWLSAVGIVGGCALAAGITARRFRALVPSDGVRWLAALVALLVLDFETTNFINVIYLAVLPMAAVAALGLARPGAAPGRGGWLLPVLCLTKPGVLTVLPPLVLAAWRGGRRMRLVVLACAVVAGVQLARIALSHGAGAMPQHMVFSLPARGVGAGVLSLGFLTAAVVPGGALLPPMAKVVAGAMLVLWIARRARLGEASERALILCGALVLAGNFALLALTLGDDWLGQPRLAGLFLIRQNLPAFLGAELIVLGLAGGMGARGPAAFAVWAAAIVAVVISPLRHDSNIAPDIHDAYLAPVSQWGPLADEIDARVHPLCVPIDPAGWVLGYGCRSLTPGFGPGLRARFAGPPLTQVLLPEPPLAGRQLVSLAVIARPLAAPVQVIAHLHLRNGGVVAGAPVAALPARGGLLLFPLRAPIADIAAVDVRFSAPVQLARDAAGTVVAGWFGD